MLDYSYGMIPMFYWNRNQRYVKKGTGIGTGIREFGHGIGIGIKGLGLELESQSGRNQDVHGIEHHWSGV